MCAARKSTCLVWPKSPSLNETLINLINDTNLLAQESMHSSRPYWRFVVLMCSETWGMTSDSSFYQLIIGPYSFSAVQNWLSGLPNWHGWWVGGAFQRWVVGALCGQTFITRYSTQIMQVLLVSVIKMSCAFFWKINHYHYIHYKAYIDRRVKWFPL